MQDLLTKIYLSYHSILPPLKLGGASCFWNLDKEGGHEKEGILLERGGFQIVSSDFIIIGFFLSGNIHACCNQ